MTDLFMTVADMSLKAVPVIGAVLFIRIVFRLLNIPCRISYFLWGVVLLRLLVPTFYVSKYSVLPSEFADSFTAQWADDYVGSTQIIHDNAEGFAAAVEHGNTVITDSSGARYVVTGADGISQPETVKTTLYPILAGIWAAGMVGMAIWNLAAILRLKRQLAEAIPIESNVFIADSLETAFVLGFFSPRIYLPSTLSAQQLEHILAHERQHIRRGDHIIKIVAFAALCIHWFNPAVWLAYTAAMEDMELSCDEAVTRDMNEPTKSDYAQTLLQLTAGCKGFVVAPVAFGEGNTAKRIRHVFRYQEPVGAVAVVVVLCVAFCLLGYLTDPLPEEEYDLFGSFLYYGAEVVYGSPEEDWSGAALYLTTSDELFIVLPDETVQLTVSSSFPWDDAPLGDLFGKHGLSLGKTTDHRTAHLEGDGYYLLSRHESHSFYLSRCRVDPVSGQNLLWTIRLEPAMNILALEEQGYYEYCLKSLGISDGRVFGTRYRNISRDGLLTDYVSESYCFVGFTCGGGEQVGWCLFRIDNGFPTFTGQMQLYNADANNGMVISSTPATLNSTGEITDDTACDVVLVTNPQVATVVALYDNDIRYNWPLDGSPAIVVMPWEYETHTGSSGSKTYLYFQDKNGSLIFDSNADHTEDETLLFGGFSTYEQLAQRYLTDPSMLQRDPPLPAGIKSIQVCDGEHPMVQFETYGLGGQYQGFYYSPDDVPLAFQNIDLTLIETEDGWAWQDEGDNHGTTKRITKYWFSYTADL